MRKTHLINHIFAISLIDRSAQHEVGQINYLLKSGVLRDFQVVIIKTHKHAMKEQIMLKRTHKTFTQ